MTRGSFSTACVMDCFISMQTYGVGRVLETHLLDLVLGIATEEASEGGGRWTGVVQCCIGSRCGLGEASSSELR